MDTGIIKNLKNLFIGLLPKGRTSPELKSPMRSSMTETTESIFPNGSVSEGPSIQNIPARKIKAGLMPRRESCPIPSESHTNQHVEALKLLKSNTSSIDNLLFEACIANNPALCKELIDKKRFKGLAADPNWKNSFGKSVLHIAAAEGYLQVCEVLLAYGSNINVNLQDNEGKTALHLACIYSEVEISQLLVRAGASVEISDNSGNTPLHYATSNNKLMDWLLANNPDQKKKSTEVATKKTLLQFVESADCVCSDDESPVNAVKEMNHACMIEEINSFFLKACYTIRITPNDFMPIKVLGQGNFGEVYLVEKNESKKLFAMKILEKSKLIEEHLVRYAITERNVMSSVKHPFIVGLRYAFQTQSKLYLIEDYCSGGCLKDFLVAEHKFAESRSRIYICEILLALEELHRHDIIYRDLKPENVVIDREGHALLTDFGLSKEDVLENDSAHSFCGSVSYLAPEMLKRAGHGKPVDWYLLGVLLYEMLTGSPPYFDLNQKKMFLKIQQGKLKIPEYISDSTQDFLVKILEKSPDLRLGTSRGAEEIKQHEYFEGVNWDSVRNKELKPPVPLAPILTQEVSQDAILDTMVEEQLTIQGWTFISESDN